MVHSVAKFPKRGDVVLAVQNGATIGFLGDFLEGTRVPLACHLPEHGNPWKWETVTIVNDGVALAARYAAEQPGGNELWMMPTPAPATAGEHALPRMLVLPKRYALRLAAARGLPCHTTSAAGLRRMSARGH